jgi:hypothetical protein
MDNEELSLQLFPGNDCVPPAGMWRPVKGLSAGGRSTFIELRNQWEGHSNHTKPILLAPKVPMKPDSKVNPRICYPVLYPKIMKILIVLFSFPNIMRIERENCSDSEFPNFSFKPG